MLRATGLRWTGSGLPVGWDMPFGSETHRERNSALVQESACLRIILVIQWPDTTLNEDLWRPDGKTRPLKAKHHRGNNEDARRGEALPVELWVDCTDDFVLPKFPE